MYSLLLSIFTIFLGILSVHKEDVTIPLTTLNFVMIYFTFSRRKFEFFIPTWIKYSLRKFFPFMMIMYLAAVVNMKNKEHIPTKQYCKTTNDDVLTLYYRYIREMSSKLKIILKCNFIYIEIITEIKNENPNVEYIKNQLKEGEINLEGKKRTTFENLSNYL